MNKWFIDREKEAVASSSTDFQRDTVSYYGGSCLRLFVCGYCCFSCLCFCVCLCDLNFNHKLHEKLELMRECDILMRQKMCFSPFLS